MQLFRKTKEKKIKMRKHEKKKKPVVVHSFHCALCAHWHEHRRRNGAVRQLQRAGTRFATRRFHSERERMM
jgi:predicted alpha/beta hydrolase family esterase